MSMLDGLRIMSKNFVGRAILSAFAGLIVIGFGFFGIRDVFNNFRANQLATVGDAEIGVGEYRNEYQNELQRLQRQAKRAITNEEARQAGLDRQVLARLLTGAALDQNAHKLGLAISDAEIARAIRADKTFFGVSGEFDQARLVEILRDNGYTETGYVREQRAYALRQQISAAVSGSVKAPTVLLEAINKYNVETRKADYFLLAAPDASQVAVPPDDAVKAFYDMRQDSYRTPEYRSVTVLIASPPEMAKAVEIADEAARKVYDETAAKRFSVAEKRAIAQLTFATKEAADKAKARIDGGESFDAVAADKDAGGVLADLGVTTKDAIFDKAAAEAAFALAEPGVAAPAQGKFGFVLERVTKIEAGSIEAFDTVKDKIKTELAQNKAKIDAQKLHDKVEDLRSAGKTLAQAAQEVGQQTQSFVTDAAGGAKGASAAPNAPLVAAPELLKAIFASDVGVDNDAVSRKDGGFSWFEISAIDPSRLPPFEEVKPAVVRSLQENNAQRELAAKANDLARQIDAGGSLVELAIANHVIPQQAVKIKRSGSGGLNAAALSQIFGLPVGAAGVALADKGARVVFQVSGSETPPLDLKDPTLAGILPQLEGTLADDVLAEYISGLQNQLGTKINQAALRAATGSDQ